MDISRFRTNDAIVDRLVSDQFISNRKIEKVFRMVDRGFYQTEVNSHGYTWNHYIEGSVHLLPPHDYVKIIDSLRISRGMSFLHIGSGTGYCNTLVGFFLGRHGINHGIELNEYLVDYSCDKLQFFLQNSEAILEFEFCQPNFKQGNGFRLNTDFYGKYDRVLCSAAIPDIARYTMRSLLKEGGILITPLQGILQRIRRFQNNCFHVQYMAFCRVPELLLPKPDDRVVKMFEITPPSLLELARDIIRQMLKKTALKNEPHLARMAYGSPVFNLNLGIDDETNVSVFRLNIQFVSPAANFVVIEEGDAQTKMYQSPYSRPIAEMISKLPVPDVMKRYLNYGKDLHKIF